jgi:hypothetical protein
VGNLFLNIRQPLEGNPMGLMGCSPPEDIDQRLDIRL